MLVGSGALYLLTVGQTFDHLERQQEQVEIDRIQAALGMELASVLYIAEDFGHWDLTYEFAQTRAADYLEANLSSGETEFIKIDVILFLDTNNQPFFTLKRSYQTKEVLEIEALEIPEQRAKLLPQSSDEIAGVLTTRHGPLLIAAHQILDSQSNGPPRGFVIFGRLLMGDVIKQMSELTRHQIEIVNIDESDAKTTPVLNRSGTTTQYRIPIQPLGSPPLHFIQFTTARTIKEQGDRTFYGFITAMAAVFIIITWASRLLFIRYVATGLLKLDRRMKATTENDLKSNLTHSERPDEIGDLERSFDAMIERLHEYQVLNTETNQQLRQSEKLNALGQLTGGIAHDFNNLLLVVNGNIELAQQAATPEQFTQYLDRALTASNKASKLIQYLLAYVQKHPFQTQNVDLGELLTNMEDLLQSTLGDRIRLVLPESKGSWIVMSDLNQLETAILNLAINARDALPDGGRVNFEISEKEHKFSATDSPRNSVVLEISDNGVGMDDEIIAHAFDPFFTTKPIGKGSGLGLSMVHGFVRQSGGEVSLSSTIGKGTTVSLILPSASSG
ncbi:MAG: CHASE4 domain-containing protein [Pseudomonadota bacterium]